MNNDLPAPLVPADVNITGLDGFMLNVQRLFASELWALSTGDEFKAAMGLWGRAWQQSPPGSLPDDDRVLGAFSGAGPKWKKVRDVALRGFVKCSDGRLYHTVLCEDVMNAAKKREAFRDRTKAATEARKRAKDENEARQEWLRDIHQSERDEERNDVDNEERNVAQIAPAQQNVTNDVTSVQGQGQGHKKEEEAKAKATVPETAEVPLPLPTPDGDPILATCRAMITAFDEVQAEIFAERRRAWPSAKDLTTARRWVEAGADIELVRFVVEAQSRKLLDRGGEPPKAMAMFLDDVLNAIDRGDTSTARTSATPAEPLPIEDHATRDWRFRLEGFRDYGAWSQANGPKPQQPRPAGAQYPEDLATSILRWDVEAGRAA